MGTLEEMFAADYFQIEKILAPTDPVPRSSKSYDGIVILGGPMAVYDNLPYLLREQDLIKDAIKNNTPTLGICLGSQLIAQAGGGIVYKGEKKEIGWRYVYLTASSRHDIFSGINNRIIRVFQWHGDTYDLPGSAKILAHSDLYPQAFRIGSALGIQFHIEVNASLIRSWIEEYSEEMNIEMIKPESLLPASRDLKKLSSYCRLVYNNFSKLFK